MNDRELSRAMSEAARLATEQAMARGYGRSDKVTKTSARQAAEDVHRAERPEEWAPKPAPVIPLPHIPDPIKDRLDRVDSDER